MTETTKAQLSHDGQQIAADTNAATIVIQRVRHNAYRLSIRHASTGAEVSELSQSFPAETQARSAARGMYLAFRLGFTVVELVDLAYATTATT